MDSDQDSTDVEAPADYEDTARTLAHRLDQVCEIIGVPIGTPWPAVRHILWWMARQSRPTNPLPLPGDDL